MDWTLHFQLFGSWCCKVVLCPPWLLSLVIICCFFSLIEQCNCNDFFPLYKLSTDGLLCISAIFVHASSLYQCCSLMASSYQFGSFLIDMTFSFSGATMSSTHLSSLVKTRDRSRSSVIDTFPSQKFVMRSSSITLHKSLISFSLWVG